ncbi:hypothetical protein JW948_16750 [bacterium]|nr:hypothetical protein [bacterium]
MNLQDQLQIIYENLPEIHENLGNHWGPFIRGFDEVSREVLAGNRNKGRTLLRALIRQSPYLTRMFEEKTGPAVQSKSLRGAVAPVDQVHSVQDEKILAQHIEYQIHQIRDELNRINNETNRSGRIDDTA